MKINRVDRRRLYQQIADDIERMILDGTFPPGIRLPGEHDLADQYGVSRNVIREAFKRLREHGLVTIKTGSGAYVRQPTTKPVSDALSRLLRHSANDITIAHFYEMRRILEPESARIAAQRAGNDDLDTLKTALLIMKTNQNDSETWSNADLDFHLAIASSTYNPLMASILDPLTGPLRRVIAAGYTNAQNIQAGLEAHQRIFEAIRSQNPDDAYQAMLEHLLDSEQRLSKVDFTFDD